jgi:hypothetical protein
MERQRNMLRQILGTLFGKKNDGAEASTQAHDPPEPRSPRNPGGPRGDDQPECRRRSRSTQDQSINDGSLDTLIGGTGKDYFRFEEIGALSTIEALNSDFVVGVDMKP